MASCACTAGGTGPPGAGWHLRLLDGWQLGGAPPGVRVGTRERRLLSLLALRGERPRANVAGLLWPDSDEARAQGNLRAAVWRVQHLADGLLVDHDGALRLSAEVRVDVQELRSAAWRLAAGAGAGAGDALLEMLCHDELLPGWDEEWVREERALLHQLRLRALERLSDRLLDSGQVHLALRAAMRAVAIDPLRESAHRALVRVHVRDGNHVEALRVYGAFRRRLSDELGVAVSAQMLDLVRPLRVGEPAARPAPVRYLRTS